MVSAMACLRASIYKISLPINPRSEAVIFLLFFD